MPDITTGTIPVSPDVADPTTDALAYLGDAVVELLVREQLVKNGLCGSSRLNSAALKYVKATAQSEAVDRLLPVLSEKELNVYKRGRNAGHGKNTPKSATMGEYRRATGFEALFGSLWLSESYARAAELIAIAYPDLFQRNS